MELNEIKRDPSRPLNDVRITTNPEGARPMEMVPPPHIQQEQERKRKWYQFCYDSKNKTVCDRSCKSWLYILAYSIFYIIFLSTYTLILLYASLCIIKSMKYYSNDGNVNQLLMAYGKSNIGLTATPTAVNKMSLISYKDSSDYMKYVTALENIVKKRHSDIAKQLGPCGVAPFGYGDTPCVIVRINKHYGSSASPIQSESFNTSGIPQNIKLMAKKAYKLWLQCGGNSAYDKEHIGTLKYFPNPPGFDPGIYHPDNVSSTELIGVQFSNFTKGIALAVECSLYYEGGKSTVDFVLFVSGSNK